MQSTRERIIHILKRRGQITVEELRRELGLTAVTVRHHLDILRRDGLVAPPEVRHRDSPGRPQYVYSLTRHANALFPKKYALLMNLLLDRLEDHASASETREILEEIGRQLAQEINLPAGADLETRLTAIVEFMNQMGYMARWEPADDEGYRLHVSNCPYEKVARNHPQLCIIDQTLLTEVLGASLKHSSCISQGDLHCTHLIQPDTDR